MERDSPAGCLLVQAPELSNNVEGLLVAVKATNDFENDMARRFGGSGVDPAADEVSALPSYSLC